MPTSWPASRPTRRRRPQAPSIQRNRATAVGRPHSTLRLRLIVAAGQPALELLPDRDRGRARLRRAGAVARSGRPVPAAADDDLRDDVDTGLLDRLGETGHHLLGELVARA